MITQQLAAYISTALQKPLPREARDAGVAHMIDTIASMVAGTRLAAGRKVIPYVAALGGLPESTVVGLTTKASAMHAALANGMLAHADETDNSPRALAHASRLFDRSGLARLRAAPRAQRLRLPESDRPWL